MYLSLIRADVGDVDNLPISGRAPNVHLRPSKSGISRRLGIWGFVIIGLGIVSFMLVPGELFTNNDEILKREVAPDFTLPTTDGIFTLSDYKGKVIVLYYSFPR